MTLFKKMFASHAQAADRAMPRSQAPRYDQQDVFILSPDLRGDRPYQRPSAMRDYPFDGDMPAPPPEPMIARVRSAPPEAMAAPDWSEPDEPMTAPAWSMPDAPDLSMSERAALAQRPPC